MPAARTPEQRAGCAAMIRFTVMWILVSNGLWVVGVLLATRALNALFHLALVGLDDAIFMPWLTPAYAVVAIVGQTDLSGANGIVALIAFIWGYLPLVAYYMAIRGRLRAKED